jgi:hypothetical protein
MAEAATLGELRLVWVCEGDGCGLRVRNVDGRPIPEPAKWADSFCARCRIEVERLTNGLEAAKELEDELVKRRKRPRPFTHSPNEAKKKPKPVGVTAEQQEGIDAALRETFDTDAGIAESVGVPISAVTATRDREGIPNSTERRTQARAKQVAAVLAEHPDWTNRKVADHLGIRTSAVGHARNILGLDRRPAQPDTREVVSNKPDRRRSRKEARRARIVAYLHEHPNATNKQVADVLKESQRTIQKDRYAMRLTRDRGLNAASEMAKSPA